MFSPPIWSILAIFLLHLVNPASPDNDVEQKLKNLQKIVFHTSNNFYFTTIMNQYGDYFGIHFIDGKDGVDGVKPDEPTASRPMAKLHPNIDIHFYLENRSMNLNLEDGNSKNLKCNYVVWSYDDEVKMPSKCGANLCTEMISLQKGWMMELPLAAVVHQFMPPAALEANKPENIADLEEALNGMSEHDILRTCASAYLHRGSTSRSAMIILRGDWVLYLLEGELQCNSEKIPFRNPFKVSLWQMNTEWSADQPPQCGMHAKLSEYQGDAIESRNFLIAAIIGSAQLDKCYDKSECEKMDGQNIFWSGQQTYPQWNKCAENYAKSLKNDKGQFIVRLEVDHDCNGSMMRTYWIINVAPMEHPDGIYDWKEKQRNATARAIVDLVNRELTMPDGTKFIGRNYN